MKIERIRKGAILQTKKYKVVNNLIVKVEKFKEFIEFALYNYANFFKVKSKAK